MSQTDFDLVAAARQAMIERGFHPDLPPQVSAQAGALPDNPLPAPNGGVRDLRGLLWSSIDNDTSRDLDQIEVAAQAGDGIHIQVGIADVDADVPADSPIDMYAADAATTVYAAVATFPMLPERLSTDLTSLAENADRLAIVVDMVVEPDGSISSSGVYRALVHNRAQLTYHGVGPWLEGKAEAPSKVAASAELQEQLRLQDMAAQRLRDARHRLGALNFDRVEAEPVISDGQVRDIAARKSNHAAKLIEDFMIAANETIAGTLDKAGVSSIRRVVKAPERWPRIVELAAGYGYKLPAQPDAAALNAFLLERKQADRVRFADVSLSVLKLMGPGEYVLVRPGDPDPGHFALAAHDYTHSTAPNRRFADLVTQRLVKAVLAQIPAPYTDDRLDAVARHCTQREDAARKVQRDMNKRVSAVALGHRVGQSFSAVVTGVTPKGVFVRVLDPPVEGRLMRGEHGLDVGDRVHVKLLSVDPARGFIDFGR
jgi:VacB/RNase II family 3'-5' exoribonuclease